MSKVTIIVPVYNQENYLRECLDSLINQTLKDIEILCIDDGSTDSSSEILYAYEVQDKRVKVIYKENTGYGDSVNVGLSRAESKYIGIVESDDFVERDMFERLYQKAEEFNTDIIKADYYNYYTKSGLAQKSNNFDTFSKNQILSQEEKNNLVFGASSIWCGLYRKDFLRDNNIWFLNSPGASYQDTSFSFISNITAKRVVLIDKALLFYRSDNINSSVNDCRKLYCIVNEFNYIKRYIYSYHLEWALPLFAKAKFTTFLWNYNRLEYAGKKRFLLCMYEQFRRDCFAGLWEKKYWLDEEWEIGNSVIFNLESFFIKNNHELLRKNIFLKKEIMFDVLKDINILILGMNENAVTIKNKLKNLGIEVTAFISEKPNESINSFENIPVIHNFKLVDEKGVVILAVSDQIKDEIRFKLESEVLVGQIIDDKIFLEKLEL